MVWRVAASPSDGSTWAMYCRNSGFGPDDEHALAVELLAVLEEQEGGPVQADRGLAGARTALHHEAGVERRADHHVLLGRDRGDDVAHLAGAGALELGEQRIGDAAVVGGVDAVGVVEHLVEEVVDLARRSSGTGGAGASSSGSAAVAR